MLVWSSHRPCNAFDEPDCGHFPHSVKGSFSGTRHTCAARRRGNRGRTEASLAGHCSLSLAWTRPLPGDIMRACRGRPRTNSQSMSTLGCRGEKRSDRAVQGRAAVRTATSCRPGCRVLGRRVSGIVGNASTYTGAEQCSLAFVRWPGWRTFLQRDSDLECACDTTRPSVIEEPPAGLLDWMRLFSR